MAPSRRKGCGKAAAAAAAACRQWKVGDLVLAKVKGYPAWPATVSEPEKWGYSSDAKKVLVYFFGTQQIALCNPVDVEPFTEERKETLLTKRHGKGADFVRALHEIIDSYEQLKEKGEVACNPADNVTRKNSGISGDHLGPENRNEASNVALNLCAQTPLLVNDKELKVAAEDAVEIVKESDIFPDKVTITKDPKEKNQGNTYFSRKRFRGAQPNSCSSQKKVVTAPRSKFVSRVDVSKFEKSILSPSNDGEAATDVPASHLLDEIRSKKVWKSPNVADEETDLHAMPLNGSSEDNGSEILTVDSEAISLNEDSTMDSDCNLQHPEPVLEHCDEIELNQRSVLEEESVIFRKRRKQSRKRSTIDASDAAKLVEDTGSEAALRAGQHFPDERQTPLDKGDGDEHLPLVKRARVRLDRSSSTKEDLDISSPLEEKSSLLLNKVPGNICSSLTSDGNCIVDKKTFIVKFAASDPVLPIMCSQSSVNQLQVSDGRSNAKMGCPVDGEAALPPSKRLHRALEAMSAKVAENTKSEASFSIKTYRNGSISSRESPEISVSGNGGKFSAIGSFELTNVNASPGINCTGIITSSELPEAEERANSPSEEVNCNKLVSTNSNQNNEFCEVRALENFESDKLRSLPFSSLGESIDKVVMATTPKEIFPSPGIQEDNLGYDEGSLEPLSPSKVGGQDGNVDNNHKIEKSLSKPYTSHDLKVVSDPGSRDAEFAVKLPVEGGGSDMMKPSNSPVIKKIEASQMFNVTGDIKHAPIDSDAITSPTAMKDIAATEYLQNLSGSTSISLDQTGERDISGQGSSSSMTNRLGSIPCESPPSTSVCNDSTIENDKMNIGSRVLTSHAQYVKSKDINKRSSMTEVSATLISFESALGSLTRTKETIGRATKIAMDCAKCGNATKVVEIIARNLETEPSLHRRVDLFFLVDSVAQCSRGLKGEVGDTYPSAIQALLQRLLLAAAPPGSSALENRRQCLKVLRLWLERRILPESIIRHHIRELETLCCSSSGSSRRPLRTERPFDDPVREMEGMLVDEYGSNSSLKLAGLCMPPMLKDEEEEGSDSDCDNFEAVTPEHEHQSHEDKEIVLPTIEKHTRILEEVDGELEMEDVAPAPSCDAATTSISNAGLVPSNVLHQFEKPAPLPFLPPLPVDMPPSSPPLPVSPPPPLPPPSSTILVHFDSKVYADAHAIGQSIASVNPEVVPFHVPEPCVSNGQPVPHLTVQPASGIQEKNETSFHNAVYPMRPPQPAPSNQFSYMHPDHHHQQLQPQREVPHPSHPGAVGGNFCNDFDRRNMGLHEHVGSGNNWRFPGPPPISGMYYPDCSGGSYAAHYPPGPPCDPSAQMSNNHGWQFPQWNTNHLEFIPHRPPAEGPMPVAIRAPCFWQPR